MDLLDILEDKDTEKFSRVDSERGIGGALTLLQKAMYCLMPVLYVPMELVASALDR